MNDATIDLYASNTSNSQRVAIMLEECALGYRVHKVDLSSGEQRTEPFLSMNPAGAVPVIVDHAAPGGTLTLTQSAAILLYLAMRAGRFFPKDAALRAHAFEWLAFASSDFSTMSTMLFLNNAVLPDKSQANAGFFENRLSRYLTIADDRLASREFLVDEVSIADFALYPIVRVRHAIVARGSFPNLVRWTEAIAARPGVARAMAALA
ncbi:MAG TPA: glutathione S-transferase family protein [Casimicrobiaceae bacterium]|nr:glutathione S-transferase family protein [Casimicrobiaceae bacterium]